MQHEPLSDANSATVANQAQEKSLADSPCSFDDYPHLTDDQYDLYDRMSEISEECWYSGWIVWTPNGPQFVPMAQWLALFEAWQAKNAALHNTPDPTPAVTSLPPAGLPPCPSS